MEHTGEGLLEWLDKIWKPEPRTFIFSTGKAGAILQYMMIYEEFCNPTDAERIAYRQKLEEELREGIYTIGGENHIQYNG